MKDPSDDPRTTKNKTSKSFAIYAIGAVALIYVIVRIVLFIQSGE